MVTFSEKYGHALDSGDDGRSQNANTTAILAESYTSSSSFTVPLRLSQESEYECDETDTIITTHVDEYQQGRFRSPQFYTKSGIRTPTLSIDGAIHSEETKLPKKPKRIPLQDKKTAVTSSASSERTTNTALSTPTLKRKASISFEVNSEPKSTAPPNTRTRSMRIKQELAAFAEELADDQPLGKIMNAAFAEIDLQMRLRQSALCGASRMSILGKPRPQWEEEAFDYAAKKRRLSERVYDEHEIRVRNMCAERIQRMRKREAAAKARREAAQIWSARERIREGRIEVWKD